MPAEPLTLTRIGAYELLRPLGSGTFARTFEARHALLGTRACVKIGRVAADNGLLLEEARLLWDFHHPSLPSLHEVLTMPDGCLALVMRYVDGQTLEALTPLDVPTAARLLGRLLRALRLIHHRGIVHNDVKPANVIVEPDRHGVVLVDFGVSASRPRRGSRAPGLTPAFAAPEILAGAPPSPASDLYALGLTFLHALGGDIERRTLPPGVPDEFLGLLVAMTRRDASTRATWGRDDPGRRLEALLPSLS